MRQKTGLRELVNEINLATLNRIATFGNVVYQRFEEGKIDFYRKDSSVLIYRHKPAYAMAYSSSRSVTQ